MDVYYQTHLMLNFSNSEITIYTRKLANLSDKMFFF